MVTLRYHSIRNLETDEVDPSLDVPARIARLWTRSRDSVLDEKARKESHLRWGIEQGLVEDLFVWDRGVTLTLINQGISADLLAERTGDSPAVARKNVELLQAHIKTLEELEMDWVKREVPVTAKSIRELHEMLVGPQSEYTVYVPDSGYEKRPLPIGKFKTLPNNPSDVNGTVKKEYCPPEQTEAEVLRLCDLYRGPEVQSASPTVRAAWLHHRFTEIHPFADGNGRVARTLATLEFLKSGFLPLIIRREEDRSQYLDSLEAADDGNLFQLTTLFVARQVEEVSQLLHAAPGIGDAKKAIEEASEALLGRFEVRLERARELFNHVHAGSSNRFNTFHADISRTVGMAAPTGMTYKVEKPIIVAPGGDEAHAFDRIVCDARQGYSPRTSDIAAYFHVAIQTDDRFSILVHLHERAAREGGGFALAGIAITDDLETSGRPLTLPLPVEPVFVSVAESRDPRRLQEILQWAGRVIEIGVSVWGRSV